jgi:hypothetical protein
LRPSCAQILQPRLAAEKEKTYMTTSEQRKRLENGLEATVELQRIKDLRYALGKLVRIQGQIEDLKLDLRNAAVTAASAAKGMPEENEVKRLADVLEFPYLHQLGPIEPAVNELLPVVARLWLAASQQS